MEKKLLFSFILSLTFSLVSCDNSSTHRNPYLREANFTFEVNLNLPLYGSLNTPGNAIYIDNSNVGLRGVIVFNAGFGSFFAWEASCPNHIPNQCSTMIIEGGVTCKCSCEGYTYSLSNGVPLSDPVEDKKLYGLLNYRVDVQGNVLFISN